MRKPEIIFVLSMVLSALGFVYASTWFAPKSPAPPSPETSATVDSQENRDTCGNPKPETQNSKL